VNSYKQLFQLVALLTSKKVICMSESQALVPVDEQSVEFYGDAIIGVLVEVASERRIYVPVRPICENLGLAWGSQRNRIYRDEVLREELRGYS